MLESLPLDLLERGSSILVVLVEQNEVSVVTVFGSVSKVLKESEFDVAVRVLLFLCLIGKYGKAMEEGSKEISAHLSLLQFCNLARDEDRSCRLLFDWIVSEYPSIGDASCWCQHDAALVPVARFGVVVALAVCILRDARGGLNALFMVVTPICLFSFSLLDEKGKRKQILDVFVFGEERDEMAFRLYKCWSGLDATEKTLVITVV